MDNLTDEERKSLIIKVAISIALLIAVIIVGILM